MTAPFRLLVCGGRTYADRARVFAMLDDLRAKHGKLIVMHGGAQGADKLAAEWSKDKAHRHWVFEAEWKKYGMRAGPLRNQRMLDNGKPNLVVAFPGGKGTADMIRRAKAAGIEVIEIAAALPSFSAEGVDSR